MSAPSFSASPCIAAAMRAASRRMTALYDEAMAPSGLRVTQYHILSELDRRIAEPPTVGELAEVLVMERSALGQTLRPLERDGLVALGRDARDRRRRPIVLTEAGMEALARGRPYWNAAHLRFQRYFGDEALVSLRTVLRGIAEDPDLPALYRDTGGPADRELKIHDEDVS